MKFELETVTPEVAMQLLGKNTHNRPLKRTTVEQYARAMEAGQWGLSPQPIAVNNGLLIDGQHRLSAVVKSGCAVPMMVAYDVPLDAVRYVDTGAPRTVGDIMKLTSGETKGAKLKAMVNIWLQLEGLHPRRLQAWEVEEACARYADEVEWSRGLMSTYRFGSANVLGVFAWAYPSDPDGVSRCFDRVSTGDRLRANAPEKKLREWIIANGQGGGRRERMLLAMRILSVIRMSCEGRESLSKFHVTANGYEFYARQRGVPLKERLWAKVFVEACKSDSRRGL